MDDRVEQVRTALLDQLWELVIDDEAVRDGRPAWISGWLGPTSKVPNPLPTPFYHAPNT